MPTIATRVFPYLANVQNTAKGEGRNAAKYTDRDGVMIDLTNMAEMPAYRYANGVNCPDDTGASNALTLSIRLRASSPDGANNSEGLIYNGEIFWVHYDNGVNSAWWRGTCAADNYVVITVANLQYGVNPANYAGLVGQATVHVRVSNGGYWKLAATDLAVGIITGMINMQDAQVMKANSTSPTSGAGTYWTPATPAETAMNALCTSHDVEHTLAGSHRLAVIRRANLASDALRDVLPGLLVPFHHRFPIPYQVGVGIRTIYYPPAWAAGGAPPGVSNRTTLAAALVPGARYAWQLEMGAGQSSIGYVTRQATTASCLSDDTVTVYLLLRTTAAHLNTDLSVIINDGVGNTTTVIPGTGVGGLSATYTWFVATHVMNTASTALNIQLLNNTGGGMVGIYIAQIDVQVTSVAATKHMPQHPALVREELKFVLAGAVGAGYWTMHGGASNTLAPIIAGDIQCVGMDVHEATAPTVAGYDQHTIYVEGTETDAAPVLFNTTFGDVAYTPAAALNIDGGTEPGTRLWVRCRATATGAGQNGTCHVWAYILKV